MLLVLINVLFPVICCVCIGLVWGRLSLSFPNDFVTRLVTNITAPCLIVSTMDNSVLAWVDFVEVARLTLACLAGFAVLGLTVAKLFKLNFRNLSLTLIYPNTGNMGLSLSLLAFGEAGLALSLIIFSVTSLIHFGSSDFVLGSNDGSIVRRLAGLLWQPIFVSTLLAIAIVATGWHLPDPVAQTLALIGGITIPLMLITLGVSLTGLKGGSWFAGSIIAVTRVVGGLLVGLLVVWLSGVNGLTAKVLILQAMMPSAVFNYFFALKYNREVDSVASGVVLSTLLSFLILPFLLWILMA